MKKLLILGIGIFAGIGIAGMTMLAHADVSNPHPTPPTNSVTNAMLQQSIINPGNINIPNVFLFRNIQATSTTEATSTVTGEITLPASTTINTVPYKWPSAQGAANTTLNNDGVGNITWQAVGSQNVIAPFVAGTAITKGQAVYLQQGGALIARDNNGQFTGVSVTSITQAYTVNSAINNVILFTLGTQQNITNITCNYNAVPLTLIATYVAGANSIHNNTYYGKNVATGSNNITCSWTTASNWNLDVSSYTGAAQTTNPEATTTLNNSGAITTNITTLTNNDWIVTFNSSNCGGPYTNGANNIWYVGGTQNFNEGDSNQPVGVAGTYNPGGTQCNNNGGTVEVALAPAIPTAADNTGGYIFPASAAAGATASSTVGFATASAAIGAIVQITLFGIQTGFSALTAGTQYFLSNSSGQISTSAGTVTVKVGVTSASTTLIVNVH